MHILRVKPGQSHTVIVKTDRGLFIVRGDGSITGPDLYKQRHLHFRGEAYYYRWPEWIWNSPLTFPATGHPGPWQYHEPVRPFVNAPWEIIDDPALCADLDAISKAAR